MKKIILGFLLAIGGSATGSAQKNMLLQGFQQLPDSVKPGCYYYWMSDNISAEGVKKDIRAMAQVGIGRAFIGNVGFDESEMNLQYGAVKLFRMTGGRSLKPL